jgi:hypothetical protein
MVCATAMQPAQQKTRSSPSTTARQAAAGEFASPQWKQCAVESRTSVSADTSDRAGKRAPSRRDAATHCGGEPLARS